jgi:hypothetical protein
MSEENLLISLVFKDGARPAEIQLILAYITEILKEMQALESEEDVSSSLCAGVNDTPSGK